MARRPPILLGTALLLAVLLLPLGGPPTTPIGGTEGSEKQPLHEPVDVLAREEGGEDGVKGRNGLDAPLIDQEDRDASKAVGKRGRGDGVASRRTSRTGLSTKTLIGLAIALVAALVAAGGTATYVYRKRHLGLSIPQTTSGNLTLQEVPEEVVDAILDVETLFSCIVDNTHYFSAQPHPHPKDIEYLQGLNREDREEEKKNLLDQLSENLRQEDLMDEPITKWIEPTLRSGNAVKVLLHVFKLKPKESEDEEVLEIGSIEKGLVSPSPDAS